MHSSRLFFKSSDVFLHYVRNYKKYKKVKAVNNVSYDDRYGSFTQGDMYYVPQNKEKKYPIFVNVHGGGFVRGDKKHRRSFAQYIANKGFFVFNINHRLAPKHKFPAAVEDTLNALNYIISVKDKYNLDTSNIVISGDSAGAYYAAAAVACNCDETLTKKLGMPTFNGKITTLMSFCGLFDPLKSMWRKSPFDVAKDVARCLVDFDLKDDLSNIDEYQYSKELNIINFVNGSWPQTVLIMAENDAFCEGQGELLEEKLSNAGVEVEKYVGNEYNEFHCFHLLPFLKATKACMAKVDEFLEQIKEK